MKTALAIAGLLGLAGCAAQQYTAAQLGDMAHQETTPNLCAITLMGSPALVAAAAAELGYRHAECDWQQAKAIAEVQYARRQAQIQQQQAAQANMMNALGASALLLQQSGPHYYSAPPIQTTCQRQGVFLNCNSY